MQSHREFSVGCIGQSILPWTRFFHTVVGVLPHSPIEERDSLVPECVEHQIYPCRSTLGVPACSEEKQKVCGNCQLLCYTHQVAAFCLGGLFLCTYVNLQVHMCIPQGKPACIPILRENQQSTESSTAKLLILWATGCPSFCVSTYSLSGFWLMGKNPLVYILVFSGYRGAWLISQDMELNNAQVCSVP